MTEERWALLARAFPPWVTGGSYRTAAFARYASRAGVRLSVFTGPPPARCAGDAARKLVEYLGAGIDVHPLALAAPRVPERFQIDGGIETAFRWAVAATRALRRRRPAAIVGSGPPFAAFVSAYLASRFLRSALVLDYRDDWTSCPFEFVRCHGADRAWERRCIAGADRLVFVSEGQRRDFLARFPETEARCTVVPNGWEPGWRNGAGRAVPPPMDGRATLLFAGTLGQHVALEPFLESLAVLVDREPSLAARLLVRFLGRKSPDAEAALARFRHPRMLESLPVAASEDAVASMAAADGLLAIHTPTYAGWVPGKIYEYLAAPTPLLLVDDVGVCRDIVAATGAGWTASSADPASLRAALEHVLQRKGKGRSAARAAWAAGFTRERTMGDYVALIRATVRARASGAREKAFPTSPDPTPW